MNPSNFTQMRPSSRRSHRASQSGLAGAAAAVTTHDPWGSSHHSAEEQADNNDSYQMNGSLEQLVGGEDQPDGLVALTAVRRKTALSSYDSMHIGQVAPGRTSSPLEVSTTPERSLSAQGIRRFVTYFTKRRTGTGIVCFKLFHNRS